MKEQTSGRGQKVIMNKALSSSLIMIMVFVIGIGITTMVDLKDNVLTLHWFYPILTLMVWILISIGAFIISYREAEDE